MTQIGQMTTDLLFLLRGQWVNQKKNKSVVICQICVICVP